MSFVLFDIGGTNLRVAVSESLDAIGSVETFKTPASAKEGIERIVKAAIALGATKPQAVAGGIRGVLSDDKTMLANDAKLTRWVGKPLVESLRDAFGGVPVYLENDTALAGLGEAVYGAGKGLDIVAYHAVSTGVGGVKIENGVIDEASHGFEPGHQILDIDRTILGEDITPTLENLVSGAALEERLGVPARDIPQSDVVWDELAEYLAQGLRNTTLYWSPDVIVLGGAMMVGEPCIPLEAVRKYTVAALDGYVESPFITKAALGDESGIYGAMARLAQSA